MLLLYVEEVTHAHLQTHATVKPNKLTVIQDQLSYGYVQLCLIN